MSATLPNPAGELEREARTRRANALDALGMACLILVVLWPFGFGVGILHGIRRVHGIAEWVLRAGLLWGFIGSALWHRDSAESLGLSTPGRLWRLWQAQSGRPRIRLMLAVSGVFSGVFALALWNWPIAARFLHLPPAYRVWPQTLGQWAAMLVFSVGVSALIATCAVRYDNAGTAFRFAGKVILLLFTFATLAAWLAQGPAAFDWFVSPRLPLDMIGYTFWGFIQQLIFTAYFATRLRKGFGKTREKEDGKTLARDRLLRGSVRGGTVFALVMGPLFWIGLRLVRGDDVSWEVLPAAMLFAFPIGAAWTYYFEHNRRQMLVATLTGSFFGIIHADSYALVLLTTGLGTIFAYAAMEDRFRNLAALAVMHGVLGTTLGKMFQHAGTLRISFRVGPWNVPHPAPWVMIIPMFYLAGYAALGFWIMRNPQANLQSARALDGLELASE